MRKFVVSYFTSWLSKRAIYFVAKEKWPRNARAQNRTTHNTHTHTHLYVYKHRNTDGFAVAFQWLYQCSFVLACRAWKPIIIDRYLSLSIVHSQGVSQFISNDCTDTVSESSVYNKQMAQKSIALIAHRFCDIEINIRFYTGHHTFYTKPAYPTQFICRLYCVTLI